MPPANRRPVAAPKSRKSQLKQPGSFVGRSQPQPQSITGSPSRVEPLFFGNQSNAQFSFNTGTLPAEGSTLSTFSSVVFGNQSEAPFLSNSEETSLSAAPVVFENQSKSPFAFNSGTLPTHDFSLLKAPEPLVFGNQSNAPFAFNSATPPAQGESSLPTPSLVVDNQSNAHPELTSDTEPEEENIDKMVADMEAALAKSPTPSVSNYVPRDPNFGLDMSFGLETNLPAAIPNVSQGPNVSEYPDPIPSDSGYSLPYFSQDSKIPAPDLARPSSSQAPKSAVDLSLTSGLSITRNPIAQDSSLAPELNLPLDPKLSLANEHGNYQPFPKSITPKAPSAAQYSDPNIPGNACSLPYLVQDSNISDLVLPRVNFSQDSKLTVDPSLVPNLSAVQNTSFQQKSRFPLDPNLSLANQLGDSKPSTASTVPLALSMTHHCNPRIEDPACYLPYFGQDSEMQDSESPRPNFSRDHKSAIGPNFSTNLGVAQDSRLQQQLSLASDQNLESVNLGPIAEFNASQTSGIAQDPELPLPNCSQDPQTTVNSGFVQNLNIAQFTVAEDSSFQQDSRILLDPNLGLPNEHGNFKPIATFKVPRDLEVFQDPNVPDLASFLPKVVQISAARHSELPQQNYSQVSQPVVDPSFVPNLNVAQNPVAENSGFRQESGIRLNSNIGLVNERGNHKPVDASNAPSISNVGQAAKVSVPARFPPNFVPDSTTQARKSPLPKSSRDPKFVIDSTPSFVPKLSFAQNPSAQDSSFPVDPKFGLANDRRNYQLGTTSAVTAQSLIHRHSPNFENQAQHQDLQPNSGYQMNIWDQSCAFDIDLSGIKPNQFVKAPGLLQTPLSASGQMVDGNEDSQFDLMDTEPDYKVTPSSWKKIQLTENTLEALGHGGGQEHSTDPNPLSSPRHINSSVTFIEPTQNLEVPGKEDHLNRGLYQMQARKLPSKSAAESVTPTFNSIASKVPGFNLKQLPEIGLEPTAAHQEAVLKGNIKNKRSTIATNTNLLSKLPSPVASKDQAIASHPDAIGTRQAQSETVDHHEIRKLRAEIERKTKQISEKDERIRRYDQKLRDQDKKNLNLIKNLRGELYNVRDENLMLEKVSYILVRENRETQELQVKAKKNTDLIKRLNDELGRLRKKQSRLETANESLANEISEVKAISDTLCRSDLDLKEENRSLRASIDEAKETIRAQKAEIEDKTERIADLNACIAEISQELLWRTDELQEFERFSSRQESIAKYYRDRYCLLWNQKEALESAGDSRDTEFAKLELQKEHKHKKELGALNLQIADLQVENKRLTQRLGDVEGGENINEADKIGGKVCDGFEMVGLDSLTKLSRRSRKSPCHRIIPTGTRNFLKLMKRLAIQIITSRLRQLM